MISESAFKEAVRAVRTFDVEAAFSRPIEDTPLDSLDLMNLRAEIETRFGKTIPDDDFFDARSLRDLWLILRR